MILAALILAMLILLVIKELRQMRQPHSRSFNLKEYLLGQPTQMILY